MTLEVEYKRIYKKQGGKYMKIAIDLGHGVGQDSGASSKHIAEETIIDNVGGLVINKLKALGHTVIEVRPSSATSVSNSLVQRVQKANNSKVDLYVSIHANAGGGKGTEVYTYQGKEVKEARNVLNNLCSLGFNNRGIKGSNLYVTHYSNMTSMLIEVCFIDTQSDVELYQSIGNNKIANAIVKGLVGETSTVSNISRPVEIKTNTTSHRAYDIAILQQELNKQCKANLVVDNIAGPKTLNACITVRQGARGNITRWIQNRLNSLGYNCGNADGIFGNNTKSSVMKLQQARGLVVDGIVGNNTWKALLGMI